MLGASESKREIDGLEEEWPKGAIKLNITVDCYLKAGRKYVFKSGTKKSSITQQQLLTSSSNSEHIFTVSRDFNGHKLKEVAWVFYIKTIKYDIK